jgi:ComF family protein
MSIHRIVDGIGCLFDALAPRRCAGCGLPAPADVCEACVALSSTLPRPASRPTEWGAVHAALPFVPPVRQLIHHAKYRGRRGAAAVLGALVVERLWLTLLAGGSGPPAEVLLVPVPLGRRRRRARGYNQAALLAEALARPLARARPPGAELGTGHAVRLRETAPQVGRSGQDRRANVAGAFAWRGPPLHGRTVWVVDDVVTTGATVGALATVLQQAGASRIEGVAAAMVSADRA